MNAGAAAELCFSLGPVQGFVGEARRARDLWAGSFLLSWLTMRALLKVEQAGGSIITPQGLDQDPGWQALKAGGGEAPYHATVPNRFRAIFADVDAAKAGAGAAGTAIAGAWQALADAVRDDFLDASLREATRAIWTAEIGPPGLLWELQWVAVAAGKDSEEALARRKLWRDFVPFPPAIAEGDRCRLMSDWRELSGFSRVTADGKKQQAAFWETLHRSYCDSTQEDDGGRRLELRDGERLSAPALVKRLFPRLRVAKLAEVIGWTPAEGATRQGRWRPSYMPSTAYTAAAHWLAGAVALNPPLCKDIAALVKSVAPALAAAEKYTHLAVHGEPGVRDALCNVDGSLFYAGTVENARDLGLPADIRTELARKLRRLYGTKVDGRPLGAPSPYYAILRMDGDKLGPLLRNHPDLGVALPRFARQARTVIETHSGRLLYAGADDLLALLPLEEAIAVAIDLEALFARETGRTGCSATISAGLVFAHQDAPLRGALEESRRLLDDIAKEVNGRASLAASVFRVGGTAFEWATTWRDWLDREPLRALQGLLDRLDDGERPTRALAGNCIAYAMRDRLGPFFTEPGLRRKDVLAAEPGMLIPRDSIRALVRTAGGEALRAVSDADLDAYLDVATINFRPRQDDGSYRPPPDMSDAELCLDFVRLFRFLGSQWRKR